MRSDEDKNIISCLSSYKVENNCKLNFDFFSSECMLKLRYFSFNFRYGDKPSIIRSLESGGRMNWNGTRIASRTAGRMNT